MAIEVRLPQFGMGMQDGVIQTWHKKEGDPVVEGELLADIEAAKAIMELVAPASGTLLRILVQPGETVPIREVIALIGAEGELAQQEVKTESRSPPSENAMPANTGTTQDLAEVKVQAEPRAKRLAQAHGIDLSTIQGSGPNGRITEADVRKQLDT